ncbi:MAG TPA: hypothetical protein VGD53_33005 [Actinoallomurus sp.]|jgi:hypothetical protein
MTLTDPQGTAGQAHGIVPLENVSGGRAFVPVSTLLVRLNYFDGKFLRADDLELEQRAHRSLVHLSNQAGGPGVVHGFDLSAASAGALTLTGGLAIDPLGRVLYLPEPVEVPVADLLAPAPATAADPVPAGPAAAFAPCGPGVPTVDAPLVEGVQLYVIALAHAEALCGHEEVFGRLCQQGCATAADRPYRNEGVAVLLQPLPLGLLDPVTGGVSFTEAHLRSRVAAAWFAQERTARGSWLSAPALGAAGWCQGAQGPAGTVVPVGVLAWRSSGVVFVDPWMVRRERIEPPARRYWSGRLEARPWPDFLAQVLQFQCQLAGLPAPGTAAAGTAAGGGLLGMSSRLVEALVAELSSLGRVIDGGPLRSGGRAGGAAGGTSATGSISAADLRQFRTRARESLRTSAAPRSGSWLIDGGIVELPSAGYLPVDPQAAAGLRDQLAPVFGTGVELRICAVRRDQIPREFEAAQHLDRISLLRGRTDPRAVERVDVLVPDGRIEAAGTAANKFGFAVDLAVGAARRAPEETGPGFSFPGGLHAEALADEGQVALRGAGRLDTAEGGFRAHLAAVGSGQRLVSLVRLLATVTSDAESTLSRAKRIKVGAAAASPAAMHRLAEAVARAFAGTRRGAGGTPRVVSPAALETEALALWLTGWIGLDPFTVGLGRWIPFSVTAEAFVPNTRASSLSELNFTGQAQVLARDLGTGVLTLRVQGVPTRNTVNVRGSLESEAGIEFNVRLRRLEKGGRTIIVLSSESGAGWEARLSWSGDPIQANGELLTAARAEVPRQQRVAALSASQDPAVNQAGDLHHDLAVDALTILQGAKVNDPFFLDNALRALFPGGGETRTEARPTTDWVLFRRRTVKECEGIIAPPPVAVSKVAVAVTTVGSKDEAQAVAEALRSGTSDVAWRRLGNVEFEARTAVFRTYPSVLRQNYLDAGGGNRLGFVGYGAPTDDVRTGIARSHRVVDALAPGTTLDDNNVGLLTNPVSGIPVLEPGTEAGVFLVSYVEQQPDKDCVTVINVPEVDEGTGQELAAAIHQGNVGRVDELADGLEEIGPVGFDPEPNPDELKGIVLALQEIARRLGNRVPDAVGWMAADLSEEESLQKEAQLQRLSESFALPLVQVISADFSHQGSCSAKLFVLQRQG